MLREFTVLLAGLAVLVPAPAIAGQQMTAAGKSDFAPHILPPPGIPDFPAFDFTRSEALAPSDRDIRIEPAFAPADIDDFLKYNLQRVDVPPPANYGWNQFAAQSSSISWDIAGAYGLTALIGFSDWDWGSRSFHFTDEGWFGRDTEYLGMDKLGHAYTGYLLTEYFTQRIAHSSGDRAGAALTGAVLGMGIQTYVEVLDGFSGNGFSYEDFVADGVGVGFSMLRSTIPGLAGKLDFRMEYLPSGNDGGFKPYHDYSGQKYLLALKLGGFEEFEDTPLRFVELQAGYFARGFTEAEQARGEERRREPYVAIGFNLQELLDETPARATTPVLFARKALEYTQVPYTYAATSR
jgi:hypothetical protein